MGPGFDPYGCIGPGFDPYGGAIGPGFDAYGGAPLKSSGVPTSVRPFPPAGAGIAALCALFSYHAMDGWIRSPWLRALVGAALILLPLAPIEPADSTVGCPWYALTALF